MRSASERRELLKEVYEEARSCVRCPLHQTRTTVVFGAGDANADLMFVGEAPGANEDRLGLPFVGQAGKLLDKLLAEIALDRTQVFIANTLKCRPPDNRDPFPREIEACQDYLRRQVALIEPTVICTLGNFATKLLRADGTGISRLHGRAEEREIGSRTIRLYPLYHPAAALYNPSTLDMLRADFMRIPEILALGPPAQRPTPEAVHHLQEMVEAEVEAEVEAKVEADEPPLGTADAVTAAGAPDAPPPPPAPAQQLGLF